MLIEEIPNFTGTYIDEEKSILIVKDMKPPKSDRIDMETVPQFNLTAYRAWLSAGGCGK